MNIRRVLPLAALIIAIALAACNQLPTQMVPPEPAAELVEGQEIGLGHRSRIRLWSDRQQTNIAYELRGGRVYAGPAYQGRAVLYFDGRRVFLGPNNSGPALFTVRGNRVFHGPNTSGPVAYTIRADRVFAGPNTSAPIVYTIRGPLMFEGPNTSGDVAFRASVRIPDEIKPLLPILADQQF